MSHLRGKLLFILFFLFVSRLQSFRSVSHAFFHSKCSLDAIVGTKQDVYKAFELKRERENRIFYVKSDDKKVQQLLSMIETSSNQREDIINKLIETGRILTEDRFNQKVFDKIPIVLEPPPNPTFVDVNVYLVQGNDSHPVFKRITDPYDTKPSDISQPEKLEGMIRRGDIFLNITKLMKDEELLYQSNSAIQTIRDKYEVDSDIWDQWTNRSAEAEVATLEQAFSEYFRKYSGGDIGDRENYVPKRGYPGTLPPGELFEEEIASEDLPKQIPHPFGAFVEFPFHVRMPVTHPMIPPPLLWAALNGILIDKGRVNFDNPGELQEWSDGDEFILKIDRTFEKLIPNDDLEPRPCYGGEVMETADALRIAKYHCFGPSYDVSEQIPHPGIRAPFTNLIPHYRPDHPSLIPEEEFTEHTKQVQPYVDKWFFMSPSPRRYSTDKSDWSDLSLQQRREMQQEELSRREKTYRLLVTNPSDGFPGAKEEIEYQEFMLQKLKERVRFYRTSINMDNDVLLHDIPSDVTGEELFRILATRDLKRQSTLINRLDGNYRDLDELMDYVIEDYSIGIPLERERKSRGWTLYEFLK